MSLLAVIPARGGSKRIPGKNIRPFAGRPMIHYAIGAAKASGLFDRIVVSTDDPGIATAAELAGAEVPFVRPAELADDHTPTAPVVAHAARELGGTYEAICCIYPAVPLLRAQDLAAALELLRSSGAPFAFPVAPFPSPIQRALRRQDDGRLAPFYPEHVDTRTQDLEAAFYDAGQFYWGVTGAWLSGLPVHNNAAALVVPGWHAVDIDTEEDWTLAEALYRALGEQAGLADQA